MAVQCPDKRKHPPLFLYFPGDGPSICSWRLKEFSKMDWYYVVDTTHVHGNSEGFDGAGLEKAIWKKGSEKLGGSKREKSKAKQSKSKQSKVKQSKGQTIIRGARGAVQQQQLNSRVRKSTKLSYLSLSDGGAMRRQAYICPAFCLFCFWRYGPSTTYSWHLKGLLKMYCSVVDATHVHGNRVRF